MSSDNINFCLDVVNTRDIIDEDCFGFEDSRCQVRVF